MPMWISYPQVLGSGTVATTADHVGGGKFTPSDTAFVEDQAVHIVG